MGWRNAYDAGEQCASLEVAVEYHLTSNCSPPMPRSLVLPAVKAIERTRHDDTTRIAMPKGMSHRRYGRLVPPHVMMEELHLWGIYEGYMSHEEDEG